MNDLKRPLLNPKELSHSELNHSLLHITTKEKKPSGSSVLINVAQRPDIPENSSRVSNIPHIPKVKSQYY
jgi:hypothetical protein